jgi:ABC-type glycerol-3-phosphate transport system substrate-binding protein
MKSKKLARALLIAAFCLVTQALVFGGGSRQQQAAGVETLEAYALGSINTAGIAEGKYFTDIWKEDLGIVFNTILGNPDVLNTIIASGNLPDILFIQQYSDQETLIKAGLLLNLDDYKDKLPNLYNNPVYANSIRYRRDMVSAGTGNLYSLGIEHVLSYGTLGTENMGPYLRWDYYKELGMPVLNEFEDYIPLLKRMQDAHPVNEAGQRVYGISLFAWSPGGGPVGWMDGAFYGTPQYGQLEIDIVKNTSRSILDNDSYFKRTLQALFNANQMGIVDPDSLAQGYNDMLTKGTAGRILFSPWPWGAPGQFRTAEREAAGIGYKLVPFANQKIISTTYTAPAYVGSAWSYVVSKNTKHLDKALAFIDFMASYDGAWLMVNGRQGIKWDLDENGEPYLTQLGWDIQNGVADFPGGGNASESGGIHLGLMRRNVHPVYGRRIDTRDWIKKEFAPADSALTVDWQKAMNARDDVDYFIQHNILVNPPYSPMEPVPDNIMLIQNRVNEVVNPLSWQMIFAKDQAEFDRLWTELVEQAKGRNVDTANQWYGEAYARAKTTGAKYMQ